MPKGVYKRLGIFERFFSKCLVADGCWEWQAAKDKHGYGRFCRDGAHRFYGAHRMAWELATGSSPGDSLVCHRCDNPSCVRPAHLFLGTPAENSADMVAKGRHSRGVESDERSLRGERHHGAKLTEADVRTIRSFQQKQRDVAVRFGICQATVSAIVRRVAWGHVV